MTNESRLPEKYIVMVARPEVVLEDVIIEGGRVRISYRFLDGI